jgi:glutamate transport system permease protein
MHLVLKHIGVLVSGFGTTVELTLIGFCGAVLLGSVLAVFRVSPIAPLRAVGLTYVELFRNIPLLALLVLFVFGLPDIGITYSLFASSAICLALYSAAFVCETIRAGINTIPIGQAEAARAIGLTFTQSLRHVILPQAFRSMVQPLTNVFIGVALGSSLAAAVGVNELTGQTQVLDLNYDEPVPTFILAGVGYVLITLTAGLISGRIEKWVRFRR